MFKELKKGYSLVRTITEDDSLYDFSDYDEKLLLTNEEVSGKWFDVLINAKWTKKKNGFFKLWINDELKYDYVGPTKSRQKVYQKFGVYRTGISRYINHVNIDKLKICLEEKGKTEKEYSAYIKLKIKKYPGHQTSIDLYEKCKNYYDVKTVPSTIIYFDDVRRSKSKEKVGVLN
jgi:hypothetical protein